MPTENSTQRGFTLIELMITVALIGVLISIAVPNFQIWQAKARRSEAMTNVASIARAQTAYQAETDSYVDSGWSLPLNVQPGTVQKAWNGADAAAVEFRLLGWEPEGPVYYSYGTFSGSLTCLATCDLCFTVEARGDTDGDNSDGGVLYVHRDDLGVVCPAPVTGWSSAVDTSGIPLFEATGPRQHSEF